MTERHISETQPLRKSLLRLCALVEENARRCVLAIRTRDREGAQRVIDADHEIDALEIAIEEHCEEMLQRNTLPAEDVRLVIGFLRINADLERVGDLSTNIARGVLAIGQYEQLVLPAEIVELAEGTLTMLTKSLDAFMHMDTEGARTVCQMDGEVDDMYRSMIGVVRDRIMAEPAMTERLLHVLSLARAMERIADYATNISENVVYMNEGRIVRHGRMHSHGAEATDS